MLYVLLFVTQLPCFRPPSVVQRVLHPVRCFVTPVCKICAANVAKFCSVFDIQMPRPVHCLISFGKREYRICVLLEISEMTPSYCCPCRLASMGWLNPEHPKQVIYIFICGVLSSSICFLVLSFFLKK